MTADYDEGFGNFFWTKIQRGIENFPFSATITTAKKIHDSHDKESNSSIKFYVAELFEFTKIAELWIPAKL